MELTEEQMQEIAKAMENQRSRTPTPGSIDHMADIWVKCYTTYKNKLMEAGINEEEAAKAAYQSPQFIPLYWFGKDVNKISGL